MKKILYLGLNLPYKPIEGEITHYPIISVVPRSADDPAIVAAFNNFQHYTDLVFTSKTGVTIFFEHAEHFGIDLATVGSKIISVVGEATAATVSGYGLNAASPPHDETAEGLAAMLSQQDLSSAHIFWPHSALSRQILPAFFKQHSIRFCECIFYDTLPNHHLPLINPHDFDEIIFTSPSTVDAYIELLGDIPPHKQVTAIGSVTADYLKKVNAGR